MMLKIFYLTNIFSLLTYPTILLIQVKRQSYIYSPYFNVLFLLFIALLFLSLRIISVIIIRTTLHPLKKILGYFIAVFPLVFSFSGLFISIYLNDKRQALPYIAFQVYYFLRFFPILKQLEVI